MQHFKLSASPELVPPDAAWDVSLRNRRLLLIVPSLAFALVVWAITLSVLIDAPHGILDWVVAAPFAALMAWECFVVWQLVLSFTAWLAGPRLLSRIELDGGAIGAASSGGSRTAILIPIFDATSPRSASLRDRGISVMGFFPRQALARLAVFGKEHPPATAPRLFG